MAKIAIKSEKLTPFGGIFQIMEAFSGPSYFFSIDYFSPLRIEKSYVK